MSSFFLVNLCHHLRLCPGWTPWCYVHLTNLRGYQIFKALQVFLFKRSSSKFKALCVQKQVCSQINLCRKWDESFTFTCIQLIVRGSKSTGWCLSREVDSSSWFRVEVEVAARGRVDSLCASRQPAAQASAHTAAQEEEDQPLRWMKMKPMRTSMMRRTRMDSLSREVVSPSGSCTARVVAERWQVFPMSQTSGTITAEYEAFIAFYYTNLQNMVFTIVVLW